MYRTKKERIKITVLLGKMGSLPSQLPTVAEIRFAEDASLIRGQNRTIIQIFKLFKERTNTSRFSWIASE